MQAGKATRGTFFPSEEDDSALEASNESFWSALIDQIRADGFERAPAAVLDVGCHRGGLLERVAQRWAPGHLYGIEPVAALRKRALLRLRAQARSVEIVDPADWRSIPSGKVDLLLAMESLHFIEALPWFFGEIARVLSGVGRAYLVLGCHAENPVWPTWKAQLEQMGHSVFTHRPLDILAAGAERGLLPSVRPLRREGWVTHDPRDPTFTFESVRQMLDHHFQHKLLFRFSVQ